MRDRAAVIAMLAFALMLGDGNEALTHDNMLGAIGAVLAAWLTVYYCRCWWRER